MDSGLAPSARPGMTALFLLRRAARARCRTCGRGVERAVGQPVPDLAAAEQRNSEIAAHLELLTIGSEAHERAIDLAVARVHDRPVLVRIAVALHPSDQRQALHRTAFVRALALVADPVWVLAGLKEDLDDLALIDAVAFLDLEPALGLTAVLVHLFPQTRSCRLGGGNGRRCGSDDEDGTHQD